MTVIIEISLVYQSIERDLNAISGEQLNVFWCHRTWETMERKEMQEGVQVLTGRCLWGASAGLKQWR